MRVSRLLAAVCPALAVACARQEAPPARAVEVARSTTTLFEVEPATARPREGWAEATQSPWPAPADVDRRDARLSEACGTPDGALRQVATELADARARGLGTPDPGEVAAMLLRAGEPHVRPRLLAASGHGPLDDETMKARLAELRGSTADLSRCGVATAPTPHGGEVLVAVAVDALADLARVPVRARTGEWLSFEARLHVAARSAKLVVLGPRGAPRTVPTSLDAGSGRARARFVLDRPGAFTLQLVADLDDGPRPLLEAKVFADVDPPRGSPAAPAPGEDAGGGAQDAAALERMVAALRHDEDLPPLRRDPDLDMLARKHAERMRAAKSAAHDVGDGDLERRSEADGVTARVLGENVAHAASVELAHRALHASPSHRMNLLRADYTHIGLAVAAASDGSVYVCEVFAAR
jgi:uncharacterized protein YkwD